MDKFKFRKADGIDRSHKGADMDNPVMILEGTTYHINYIVVVDSPSSFATGGDVIPHCWSWDCEIWEGPSASFYWMIKFFGELPVPNEVSSWTWIKALYK